MVALWSLIHTGVIDSFISAYSQAQIDSTAQGPPDILVLLKRHFERIHEEKKLDGSTKVAASRLRSMTSVYLAFWLNTGNFLISHFFFFC